eukprot:scaffold1436_cov112-Cylindrotheca_fusiformis.AAC.2
MFSSQTIDIIYSSWDVIKKVPNYHQAFEERFFEALSTSGLAEWFTGPENPHQTVFVKTIDLVVHLLGPDLEVIRSELTCLGRRHQCYITDMHEYLQKDYFQEHLIDTFVETILFFLTKQAEKLPDGRISEESILHPSKVDNVRVAWNDVFTIIRTIMKEGVKLERHTQREERQRQRQEEQNQLLILQEQHKSGGGGKQVDDDPNKRKSLWSLGRSLSFLSDDRPKEVSSQKNNSSTVSLSALAAKTSTNLKNARKRAKNIMFRSPPRRTRSEQAKKKVKVPSIVSLPSMTHGGKQRQQT